MTRKMRVYISDHALVRYLERVPGPHPMNADGSIDMDRVKDVMLGNGRREAFAMGASNIKIGPIAFCSRIDKRKRDTRVVTTARPNNGFHPDREKLS